MRTARDVIDYIAWMEHCAYVQSVCPDPIDAFAAFGIFKRSASAERGRSVQ